MRRLLALLLLLVLAGIVMASAAGLDVRGGTVQGFRLEADIEVPRQTCANQPLESTTTSSSEAEVEREHREEVANRDCPTTNADD